MTEPTRQPTTRKRAPAKKAAAPTPPPDESRADLSNVPRDDDFKGISEPQMRHLHGLLRSRLGLHERADVLDYLSVALGRDVDTRRALSWDDAERMFGLLEPLPPNPATPESFAALARPFPADEVESLPKPTKRDATKGNCRECGGWHGLPAVHLSYVGHAGVTMRLLEVDPSWTWEPVATDQFGLPLLDSRGGLWIRLTVLGVTRLGYGDATNRQGGDAVKEAIGDAIRNAALRFGVATYLWSKSEAAAAILSRAGQHDDESHEAPAEPAWNGPSTAASLARLDDYASQVGKTREEVTAKWRERHGGISVGDLDRQPADTMYALAETIGAYVASLVAAEQQDKAAETPAAEPESANPWA